MELTILYIFGILSILFLVYLSFRFGKILGKRYMLEYMEEIIKKERENAIKNSRSVLVGNFSEQLSPYLPNFPLKPSEVKFLGKPVDFIGFKGLDNKKIEEIVFIEVKSGKSKMNTTEKSIEEAIKHKRIKFVEYRVDLEREKKEKLEK